jgi:uncharacterized protein
MRTFLFVCLLLSCAACRAEGDLPLPAPVRKVVDSALAQTQVTTGYDPAYIALRYPGGDVPADTGVCADVIVRALRNAGVDLQREVHRDMLANFSAYPHNWGLHHPDTNIDHRRVPNLMTFFRRQGKALPIGRQARDYHAGDLVAWDLGSGLTHIGVVSDRIDGLSGRPLIVHNIGAGARLEDVLFSWTQIGHYRYFD